MRANLKFFKSSFAVSLIGLMLGAGVGYFYGHTFSSALTAAFSTFVLSLLEISLSFDNAVVNASILVKMTPKWRHRFMTWGMLIAVFGMRIVFPILVVTVVALINPWEALVLAVSEPETYAKLMTSAHVPLAGFGGSFLLLVALRYFIYEDKEVHWFPRLERFLRRAGRLPLADVVFCAAVVFEVSRFLHRSGPIFLVSAGAGIISFVALHALMALLKVPDGRQMAKASFTMFLYLEVLDASFSLDGVIGAFAITTNLLLIAIGLGIGAMFVRSLTLLMVEKKTLNEFVYLEHGAFYAIGALAVIMLISLFTPVPEAVTGLIGVAIIGLSLLSSLRHRRAGG